MSKKIKQIYTDGSFFPDSKKGGYAAYDIEEDKLIFGSGEDTSNNQMEMKAVIEALKHTEDNEVEIVTDSRYVTDGYNKNWLDNWKQNEWKNSSGKDVSNKELWEELDTEVSKKDNVQFTWVKGHSGDPYNELCDVVAKASTGLSTHPKGIEPIPVEKKLPPKVVKVDKKPKKIVKAKKEIISKTTKKKK